MSEKRPLTGLKVVDLTHVLAGPYCTFILALLGADVVKVENVRNGDVVRQAGPRRDLNEAGMGSHYQAQGGGKRCIALDIASETGRSVLGRLIEHSDIFVENLRPGAVGEHGFAPEALRDQYPRLICARISGFGATSDLRAYDNVVQAAAGIVASTGPAGGPAVKAGPAIVDYATGLTAALAILAAIRERDRTGRGAFVDVAMHDVALALQTFEMANYFASGQTPRPHGNAAPSNAGYATYETQDGPITIGAYTPALQRRLWRALGQADRSVPAMFYNLAAQQQSDARDLASSISKWSAADLEATLHKAGVPAARIRTLDAALTDAQEAARPVVIPAPGEALDLAALPRYPGLPFKLNDTTLGLRRLPPRFGADTRSVLSEAGYTAGEIDRLQSEDVIRCSDA